jgi:hypothetical protein
LTYLICDKCNGYYELQPGESADDFDYCQCGGNLIHADDIRPLKPLERRQKRKIKQIVDEDNQGNNKIYGFIFLGLFCSIWIYIMVRIALYMDNPLLREEIIAFFIDLALLLALAARSIVRGSNRTW